MTDDCLDRHQHYIVHCRRWLSTKFNQLVSLFKGKSASMSFSHGQYLLVHSLSTTSFRKADTL